MLGGFCVLGEVFASDLLELLFGDRALLSWRAGKRQLDFLIDTP